MMNFYYTESIDVLMLSQRKKNLLIFNEYKLLLGILRIVAMINVLLLQKAWIRISNFVLVMLTYIFALSFRQFLKKCFNGRKKYYLLFWLSWGHSPVSRNFHELLFISNFIGTVIWTKAKDWLCLVFIFRLIFHVMSKILKNVQHFPTEFTNSSPVWKDLSEVTSRWNEY